MVLENLKPKIVWDIFENIVQIPQDLLDMKKESVK